MPGDGCRLRALEGKHPYRGRRAAAGIPEIVSTSAYRPRKKPAVTLAFSPRLLAAGKTPVYGAAEPESGVTSKGVVFWRSEINR